MSLQKKERPPKQHNESYPPVRRFNDSLHRPNEIAIRVAIYAIMFLASVVVFVITSVLASLILGLGCAVLAFCTYYSPKRAHSSKFWLLVAKFLVSEQSLKLDDE